VLSQNRKEIKRVAEEIEKVRESLFKNSQYSRIKHGYFFTLYDELATLKSRLSTLGDDAEVRLLALKKRLGCWVR